MQNSISFYYFPHKLPHLLRFSLTRSGDSSPTLPLPTCPLWVSPDVTNIIGFATEMINKLNIFSKDHPLTLIALPDWSKHDRLFNENLLKLSTIVFDDDYTDYGKYHVGKFICKFRDEYGTEPKDMAYHGFNIGWYFLNALINYGDDINTGIESYDIPLLNTRYSFQRKSELDGCENTYWNIYQYNNHQKNLLHPQLRIEN